MTPMHNIKDRIYYASQNSIAIMCQMNSKINNIIFDFGNVLLDLDIPRTNQQLIQLLGHNIPIKKLLKEQKD